MDCKKTHPFPTQLLTPGFAVEEEEAEQVEEEEEDEVVFQTSCSGADKAVPAAGLLDGSGGAS